MIKSLSVFISINLLFGSFAFSQADSLLIEFENKNLPESIRIDAGNELANSYLDEGKNDSALWVTDVVLDLLKQRPSLESSAVCMEYRGEAFMELNQQDSALDCLFKSLDGFEYLNEDTNIAYSYYLIGKALENQGNVPKAQEYYLLGLEIYEEITDTMAISFGVFALAELYVEVGDHVNASLHYERALQYDFDSMDSNGISASYTGLANCFFLTEEYDSVIYYFNKSLEICVILEDLYGVSTIHNNLGVVYHEQEDFELALQYYLLGLEEKKEFNDTVSIISSLANIGSVYRDLGDFELALQYGNDALLLKEKIDFKERLSKVYEILYLTHKDLGDYKKSLYMYELYMEGMDSAYYLESKELLLSQENKYEFEKAKILQEQEERAQEKKLVEELERRNNIQYTGITLGLFLLFVLLLLAGRFSLPKWGIELITFLPFLILFEFVLVLTDGYIEAFTSGIPMYKLLINVLIAALIFPIHAFFERLLKSKIFKKE